DYLVGGDIVTRLNGARLDSDERVEEAMRPLEVGKTLRLTVFRNGQERDVEYELPERPILPGDIQERRTSLEPARRVPRPPEGGRTRPGSHRSSGAGGQLAAGRILQLQSLGDDLFHHFGCAATDRPQAGIPVEALDGKLAHVPVAAEDLRRIVGDPVGQLTG